MENFITWEMLLSYTTFVSIVYQVVEFTKELPLIRKIPTKWWSAIITFTLMLITRLATDTFVPKDIVLYILSAMPISLSANGLSQFNKKGE